MLKILLRAVVSMEYIEEDSTALASAIEILAFALANLVSHVLI